MAQGFQSSFIPKEPVASSEVFQKKKAGILGTLAVTLFIASLLGWGGLFAYKKIVKGEIADREAKLAEAEKNIDKKTISEMSQFSKKLDATKEIVVRHQVVSNFLKALAASTVSTVQFDNFGYSRLTSNSLTISLQGRARDYASVAEQERIFNQNKDFKSLKFSNLALTDKGLVSFDLSIVVDPKVSVYSPDVVSAPSADSVDEMSDELKAEENFEDVDLNLDNL